MMPFVIAALLLATTTSAGAETILLPSTVLQSPGAPRSIGMGMTGTADDTDPGNSWHNPANVHVEGLWFGGAFADWPGDRHRFDFSVAGGSLRRGPGGRWSFGAALRHGRADLREFSGTGTFKLSTSESWMTLALACGYGGEGLRVAVGGAFRWSTNEDNNETTGDAGIHVGGTHTGRRVRVRYGAGWSIRNADAEGAQDPLANPVIVSSIEEQWVGAMVRFAIASADTGSVPVAICVNADARTDGDGEGAGMELTIVETADLRVGLRNDLFSGMDVTTLGAGLHRRFGFFFARIDYAYIRPDDSTIDSTHSFGSLFGFDF